MDGPVAATVVAFAVLCVAAVRRGMAFRGASVWLAVSFAAIAVTGLLVPQLEGARSPTVGQLALLGVAAGLVVHPVALVHVADALDPLPAALRHAVTVGAGLLFLAVAALATVDPDAFVDDAAAPPAATVLLLLVAVLWAATALFVGGRLVRSGLRLTAHVGRARALTMAAGVLALAPAVSAPFVLDALDESDGALFALGACVLIYLGFLPPRWLRWTWARRDAHRLADAELAALEDPAHALTPWLRTVMGVWEADAVRLEVDGHVVEAIGDPPAPPERLEEVRQLGRGVHVVRLPGRVWLLAAEVAGARLSVRTRIDPILVDDASELYLTTAARLRGAVTRRALEQQAQREHARRQEAQHREETIRLRDDVLSTLSHELRTPLVTLRGVPDILLRRLDDLAPEDVRRLLERMQDNALTLHRMVEATMLLAQVRAGEVVPHLVSTTLDQVAEEGLDRLRRVGVDLDRVAVEDVHGMPVVTDVRLAGAVTAELVHNALTYSDAPAPVRVTGAASSDELELVVVDTGRGLDGASPDVVLDAFARGGDLLTRDRRGLGVGLTLVAELVPLLQASLVVAAREDGASGTRVHLRLPLGASGAGSTTGAVPATIGVRAELLSPPSAG